MYHHIFPEDSKPVHLFKFHNVTNTFSLTPKEFDNQVRLLRNSGYWIATTSQVGKYLVERENAKIKQGLTVLWLIRDGLNPGSGQRP